MKRLLHSKLLNCLPFRLSIGCVGPCNISGVKQEWWVYSDSHAASAQSHYRCTGAHRCCAARRQEAGRSASAYVGAVHYLDTRLSTIALGSSIVLDTALSGPERASEYGVRGPPGILPTG